MRMPLVPAQKQPPEVKEEKPTATEKEGPREKAGHWQEGYAYLVKVAGKGRHKRDKKQERGQEWAQSEECRSTFRND